MRSGYCRSGLCQNLIGLCSAVKTFPTQEANPSLTPASLLFGDFFDSLFGRCAGGRGLRGGSRFWLFSRRRFGGLLRLKDGHAARFTTAQGWPPRTGSASAPGWMVWKPPGRKPAAGAPHPTAIFRQVPTSSRPWPATMMAFGIPSRPAPQRPHREHLRPPHLRKAQRPLPRPGRGQGVRTLVPGEPDQLPAPRPDASSPPPVEQPARGPQKETHPRLRHDGNFIQRKSEILGNPGNRDLKIGT